MKKAIKIAINTISTIILVAVVALAAVVFISKAQDKMTFLFNKSFVWVLTPSMETEIPAKSYILVEKIDPSDIKVGDVIVFHSDDPALDGSLNTHRVIEISEDGKEFITKGDNNVVADKYTAKADKVVARYVSKLPILTKIGRLLMTSYGFFSLVGIALVVVVLFTVPDFVNYAKSKKKEEEPEHEKTMEERIAEEVERLKAEDEKKKAEEQNNDGE
ncbi:MAG: signal peptidase I [Clostridia bacterium]|nr:signal peptidase I [Clostridia bacterium]